MEKCTYPMFFVDVDMFYKPVHHFLYQIWKTQNAKIGRWELAVADDIYIREVSGSNISAQIYNTYQYMYRATK